MTEASLSDKIDSRDIENYFGDYCFKANSLKKDIKLDIKEFIRELKESFCGCNNEDLLQWKHCFECQEIDKLAGEKLV